MARILIAYGTTEGQTRKICNFLAEQFRLRSFEARVVDTTATPDDLDPAAFDAIIVAGSVHQYRHQSAEFALPHPLEGVTA